MQRFDCGSISFLWLILRLLLLRDVRRKQQTGSLVVEMVVGSVKFCRDVVFKVNKDLAVNAFQKEKNSFHLIARKLIEKVNRVSSSQFNSDNAPAQDLKLSS
ncbi:hypothetical protein F5876DRAFT_67528 [Lentinula aff. lateritia]|uniref:Uncharacterized protein n=1 Tax=Lentinula aff. lateritia TaxID=2804960 RepID=A0ACC1TUI7_9AGAR|nr:hypothetical protein F5876DRAFT_67528 [Lentinula aff. lateritia]